MKTIFRYLVSVAALIAVFGNAVADDSPLIVMDKAYYEATASGFYSNCGLLASSVNASYSSYDNLLTTVFSSLVDYDNQLSLILTQVNDAQALVDFDSSYAYAQNSLLADAQDGIGNLRSSIYNQQGEITRYKSQLARDKANLISQVNVVSNSFPIAITDTNLTLNVYVVVTNNFDFATNQLEQAQNSYTNFLNYYRNVIDDSVLDPYRATVTNLLDMSSLYDVVTYTYWNGTQVSGGMYQNFYWPLILSNIRNGVSANFYPATWGNALGLPSLNPLWGRYTQNMVFDNSTTSLRDFLLFSLQGIHDSSETMSQFHLLDSFKKIFAETSSVFTLSFPVGQTNAMANFLHSPDSYDKQVAKIATTRNWYQRIEHWLSAIAHNTDNGTVDIKDSTRQERENELDGVTNNVLHSVTSTFDDIQDVGYSSTNAISKIHEKFTDNLASVFNHFLIKPNGSKAGGDDQTAAQRFKKLYFMETDWVSSRLTDLTHKPNDVPTYVVVQDIEHGKGANTAWSLSLKVADIAHNVFGILWSLIGFGLSIYECVMLSKFFINIWWRLLKWLPHVNRYALGS